MSTTNEAGLHQVTSGDDMPQSLGQRLSSRGLDWRVPTWSAPPWVRAFVTTRSGGVSAGAYASMSLGQSSGDDPNKVLRNRAIVEGVAGVPARWLKQVHGTGVVDARRVENKTEADAAWVEGSGLAACVMIADCMPVFFASLDEPRVAVAHAGWRGLSAGVLESTASAMRVSPNRLVTWLGPAIGPTVFEVGEEVRQVFCEIDKNAASAFVSRQESPKKWLCNLHQLARQRLERLGLPADQIFGEPDCTFTQPERYFSYRREQKSGRMAALIWIES